MSLLVFAAAVLLVTLFGGHRSIEDLAPLVVAAALAALGASPLRARLLATSDEVTATGLWRTISTPWSMIDRLYLERDHKPTTAILARTSKGEMIRLGPWTPWELEVFGREELRSACAALSGHLDAIARPAVPLDGWPTSAAAEPIAYTAPGWGKALPRVAIVLALAGGWLFVATRYHWPATAQLAAVGAAVAVVGSLFVGPGRPGRVMLQADRDGISWQGPWRPVSVRWADIDDVFVDVVPPRSRVLLTTDGRARALPIPRGAQAIEVAGELRARRPAAGAPAGH